MSKTVDIFNMEKYSNEELQLRLIDVRNASVKLKDLGKNKQIPFDHYMMEAIALQQEEDFILNEKERRLHS